MSRTVEDLQRAAEQAYRENDIAASVAFQHMAEKRRAGVDSEDPRIEVTVREHSEGGRG